MAASGTINASNRNDIKAQIECVINSQNINANKSNVTVKVKVWRTNSGYTTYGPGTVYCTINGTQYSVAVTSSNKISYGTTYTWFTKTLDIPHNSDGKKSLKITASISHSQFTIPSTSWTMTLTTIPRTSSFTMNKSSITLGDSVTFTITRASSSFTHTIKAVINGKYITTNSSVATSATWTSTVDLAKYITSATSTVATIYVETYNGATKIGHTSKTLTINVPTSVVPTINWVSYEEVGSGLGLGVYLQGKSQCKVVVNATALYSATITSYKVTIGGYTNFGATTTSGYLNNAGAQTITVVVTDSRGRSSTTTRSITVTAYQPPRNSIRAHRSNSDGTINSVGTSCRVGYTSQITAISGLTNTVKNKVYWKESSAASWTLLAENNWQDNDDIIYIIKDIIDNNKAYKFKIESTDLVSTSTSEYSLGTAYSIFHFANQGSSLGIFKSCEKTDGLEIGKQIHQYRIMNFYRNTDMKECKINFMGCGSSGTDMQIYGGADSSGTVFGVWDLTKSVPVWRYTTGGYLNLEQPLGKPLMIANGVYIKHLRPSGVWGDLIGINSAGDKLYVGTPGYATTGDLICETLVRGKNLRLYSHGGGVYLGASGSTAVTSDKNMKHTIEELDDRYLDFFSKLIPISFIYNSGKRKHIGFIAQQVEQAMIGSGIDSMEFAGLIKETDIEIDVDGNDNVQHFDELYSLRYEEFIAINIKVTQHLSNKVSNIEKDLSTIKDFLGIK